MENPDDIAHGEYKVPGGKLVVVDLAVADAALEGLPADTGREAIAAAVEGAMGQAEPYGITAQGVAEAVRRALDGTAGTGGGGA